MAIDAATIKKTYSGYTGWNDPASIVANYLATGGEGKGAAPYVLGKAITPSPAGTTSVSSSSTQKQISLTPSGIMGALATPSTAYATAAETESKMLPLIQQRYKSLLDEIKANTEAAVSGYETAQKGQIGETQARAAAAGTFAGTTELGTEDIIRQETARNQAILRSAETTQEEKLAAQQAIDEQNVATQIAQLGISEDTAYRTGLKDVLSALFTSRGLDIQAAAAATSAASVAAQKWSVQTSTVPQAGWQKLLFPPTTTSYLINEKTGETVPISASGVIQLKDPKTGQVYQYLNANDPDLQTDLAKGWQPAK